MINPLHKTVSPMRLSVAVLLLALFAQAEPWLRPNDRIVFVGDSITGLSTNNREGFRHQMAWALQEVHPDATPMLIALGGSGQSVSSWMGIEKRSRTEETFLDVRGIDVKATLDVPADVLVVMLGMNDLLAPYVSERKEDLDAWADRYRQLLHALRGRAKPRVIALGTVTPLTDDPASPKNRVREELNRRVAELAATEHCVLLHTGEEMCQLLQRGRTLSPDFHVTYDFVHPKTVGHTAIAMAILKGLGQDDAAQRLADKYLPALMTSTNAPVLSYAIAPDAAAQAYRVTYWWTPATTASASTPNVQLTAPKGWSVAPANFSATTGVFTVTGHAEKLVTPLTLAVRAGDLERAQTVSVPAPWRVAAGIPNQAVWPSNQFNPTNGILPFEAALLRGEGFDAPLVHKGITIPWRLHTASVNYTGGADPDSIDFYGITFCNPFETAYAVRWIYSEKDRPVDIVVSSRIFAGTLGATVWLNDQKVYAKALTSEPKKTAQAAASLHKGWNRLLVRSDHMTWQWQFSCALSGQGGDTLDELRYSAAPQ